MKEVVLSVILIDLALMIHVVSGIHRCGPASGSTVQDGCTKPTCKPNPLILMSRAT